jgi:integrase/recombinase XerC
MQQRVVSTSNGHRLEGGGGDIDLVNSFLSHLWSRAFSPATVRAYAYDLLNFLRFLGQRSARFQDVVATDLFDYLDWQQRSTPSTAKVVGLTHRRGAAPATMNRRIAAVRGLFEYSVITGVRGDNPVPAARRSSGLRAKPPGAFSVTSGRARHAPADDWSASRDGCPSRSSRTMSRCSSPICTACAIGRSCC